MITTILYPDGLGVAPDSPGNAVSKAKTTNLDSLWPYSLHSEIMVSGFNTGLEHEDFPQIDASLRTFLSGTIIPDPELRLNNLIENGQLYIHPKLLNFAEGMDSILVVFQLSLGLERLLDFIKEFASKKKLFTGVILDYDIEISDDELIEFLDKLELLLEGKEIGKIIGITRDQYAERFIKSRKGHVVINRRKFFSSNLNEKFDSAFLIRSKKDSIVNISDFECYFIYAEDKNKNKIYNDVLQSDINRSLTMVGEHNSIISEIKIKHHLFSEFIKNKIPYTIYSNDEEYPGSLLTDEKILSYTDLNELKLKEGVNFVYSNSLYNSANSGKVENTKNEMENIDEFIGKVSKQSDILILMAGVGAAEQMIDVVSGDIDSKPKSNNTPLMWYEKNRRVNLSINTIQIHDVTKSILMLYNINEPDFTGEEFYGRYKQINLAD